MGLSAPCKESGLASSRRIHETHNEGKTHRIPRFKLHDIHLATCGFDSRFLVVNAALAQIYRARLCDETLVFVKKAWPGDRYWEAQFSLENERLILSACKGTYLLNLVGVSDDTPERVLILEHVGCGNLFDALHKNTLGAIAWPARIQIAHHIAVAIRGLHRARSHFVHRDVKSSNVWINHNWSAKLGGFEFALRFCNRSAFVSSLKCPRKAMSAIDPDYQTTEHLCAKTDVFCFGVLLLEIITGRKIMDVNHHPPFVVDWALPLIHQNKVNLLCDPNMRPPFQNSKPVLDMARIAARCVNTQSSRRPTMAEVAEDLKMLTLKVPLFAEKGCKRGLDWYSAASMHTIQHRGVKKGALSTAEKIHPGLIKTAVNTWVKRNEESMFRSERPSMLFGRITPKIIPPRSYLGLLEDAVAKKQREPHLPPHLRHDFA